MSSALRKPMTHAEFFAWADARGNEGRYEFDGVGPVAMTGGLVRHGLMCRNLTGHLFVLLRGKRCQSNTGGGGGVVTTGNRIRYPDAVVTCAPMDPDSRYVDDPVVVFEIVSPGTARMDHVVKRAEYQGVPSVARYVVVEHKRIEATVHARDAAGAWATTVLRAGATIALPEIGIAIPLDDLYEGVTAG